MTVDFVSPEIRHFYTTTAMHSFPMLLKFLLGIPTLSTIRTWKSPAVAFHVVVHVALSVGPLPANLTDIKVRSGVFGPVMILHFPFDLVGLVAKVAVPTLLSFPDLIRIQLKLRAGARRLDRIFSRPLGAFSLMYIELEPVQCGFSTEFASPLTRPDHVVSVGGMEGHEVCTEVVTCETFPAAFPTFMRSFLAVENPMFLQIQFGRKLQTAVTFERLRDAVSCFDFFEPMRSKVLPDKVVETIGGLVEPGGAKFTFKR